MANNVLSNQPDIDEMTQNMKETEKDARDSISRYFDRIQDKLFSYNSILLAGYIALICIPEFKIDSWLIIIPFSNMCFLIGVDYKMMERCRFYGDVRSKTPKEIEYMDKVTDKITRLSFYSIVTTFVVTIIFVYQIIF